MTLQTVPLAKLVEDLAIYPRHSLDSTYVAQLVDLLHVEPTPAWKGGPVIVDATTWRIVDGWHRVRASRRVFGDNGSIEVDLRAFPSPAEVVRTAVESNMQHGRKLDKVDRVRCALLLSEAGFPRQTVAFTLHIEEKEVPRLTLRVATAPAAAPNVVPGTTSLPLKRAVAHLSGSVLTARQATAHSSMPGTSLSLLAKQLVTAIENDFVDTKNERLMGALRDLHRVLSAFL